MNLRPPVPTSDNLPKDEAKKQHRAALIPVAIGLVIVLALAGFSALSPKAQIVVIPFITDEMTSAGSLDQMDPHDGMQPSLNANFNPPEQVSDVLLARPDEASLDTEPANLPVPDKGRRIAGFMRSQNYLEDEYAFWKVSDTSIESILAFYKQAALDINFEVVSDRSVPAVGAAAASSPDASSVNQSRTLIFTRTRRPEMAKGEALLPANDVLVVRAKTLPEGHVHLTLWYRYASRLTR